MSYTVAFTPAQSGIVAINNDFHTDDSVIVRVVSVMGDLRRDDSWFRTVEIRRPGNYKTVVLRTDYHHGWKVAMTSSTVVVGEPFLVQNKAKADETLIRLRNFIGEWDRTSYARSMSPTDVYRWLSRQFDASPEVTPVDDLVSLARICDPAIMA